MKPLFRSGVGPGGVRSRRTYTAKEIVAGTRLGLVRGTGSADNLHGPMFWESDPAWLEKVRERMHVARREVLDCEVALEAMEREWANEGLARAMAEQWG